MIEILQSEGNAAIEWFIKNKMFVNPNKFHIVLLDKQKSNYTGTKQQLALSKFKLFLQLTH